jgi:pimeloyl-ACP methyl ester carboxylesterase
MGLNALMYASNVADLAEAFRVYAIDTIGDKGRSIVRRDYPENGCGYADWVADLVGATGAQTADVVGCSMGGWIATCAALYRPEVVTYAVLISPAAGIPQRTTWGDMLLSIVFNPDEDNVRKIGSKICGSGPAGVWLDWFVMATKDPQAAKLGIDGPMTDAQLQSIQVPVLLLIGDQEVVYVDSREVLARADRRHPERGTSRALRQPAVRRLPDPAIPPGIAAVRQLPRRDPSAGWHRAIGCYDERRRREHCQWYGVEWTQRTAPKVSSPLSEGTARTGGRIEKTLSG